MNTISYTHTPLYGEIEQLKVTYATAIAKVNAAREAGDLGFTALPYDHENAAKIQQLADEVAAKYKAVIVIGIGGSDLGARAVHRALNHQFYNLSEKQRNGRPKMFFAGDTTDPVALQEIIDVVDWKETVIVVISKSGNTVEPTSTFLLLRDLLVKTVGKEAATDQIIAITDEKSGSLRKIADQEGYRSLPMPGNVGGRFSVLTCVGLFPLALAGVDIAGLLRGAAQQDKQPEQALEYALMQYAAYERGQHISVLMPYTYALREVGFWFRQLWAESLGKRLSLDGKVIEVGPTPIAAVGPTDQHSQVQLYREGPTDKIFTFITVKKPTIDLTIPAAFPEIESVHYLAGHNFQKILLAEHSSTATALAEAGKPSCTIELPELNAESLGALLYFFEMATAYAGQLFNVNAFDQPGVERGKELMYAALGQK